MAKKQPVNPVVLWMKKNVVASIIFGIIFLFCVSLLFSTPHTKEQGQKVQNMETTCRDFGKIAAEARVAIRKMGYINSEAKKAHIALYKEFTPWQRASTIAETAEYIIKFDFPDSISKVLKAPNMGRLFHNANPDLMGKEFGELSTGVWKLLDAFMAGTQNDPAVLGEEGVDALEGTIKSGFWAGMEIFDDEETKYYSTKAWYSVREAFLGRFFLSYIDTMKGKAAIRARGEEITFPDEPEKEKTWADEAGSEDVQHLGDTSFDSQISTKKHAIVMFYAPWCGHCKSFKPEFQKAATLLKDADVVMAGVDCTDNGKRVCKRFGVSGYPTILHFVDGEKSADYKGGRTTFDVVDWLNHEDRLNGELDSMVEDLRPAPEPQWSDEGDAIDIAFLTDDDFHNRIGAKRHGLVMFYAPWCGHCKAMKPDFASTATALKDKDIILAAVDATKHPKVAKEFGVEGYPTLYYFQDGEKNSKYDGGRTAAGIKKWLADSSRMGDAVKSEL